MIRVFAAARRAHRRVADFVLISAISLAFAPTAYASGSSMPWETPLNSILESVQGPVAKIISVIIITVTGLTLAFGDTSGGFRRLIQIVFGLSIAFAASSFFLTFFSFSGGALI
ncbi:TrbC/VirB2 family protein [Xanthobacter sp. DSM 24535]|uniref:TrbC/VirB2 family protein n=1 Tax=Roseixanthobacter psychrophilus TaxID=3119917 RepID=UPI00372929BB